MKTQKKIIILSFIFLMATFNIYAQTASEDQSLLSQINKENEVAIDAIAMYPKEMRTTIFTACQYPEIIVRLNSMQKKTNSDFTDMLLPFNKSEQEKIWNLTRYPDLISKLAKGNKKSESEIKTITESYPKDIKEDAIREGTKNYDLLVKIDQSNKSYNTDFDQMLTDYPPAATSVFKELLKQPGVLTTLTDNMHMTIVVGDLYKKNPDLVVHNVDSLNLVLTEKTKKDEADWQQSMESNPAAKKQYEQAANDYAQENGYQSQEYYTPATDDLMDYNSYPYNWWFGYPSWYGYAYWRPYPYWYDWGFYYGQGDVMNYYGMPSARFFNWYWDRYENHYRYPEFSSHCYGYYSNHRGEHDYNPVCRGVHDWRMNNQSIVGKDWASADNAHRVELFKEYGQMEISRANYNAHNPQQTLNNQEYLKMNQEKFPTINVAAQNIHAQNISNPPQSIKYGNPRQMENSPANTQTLKANENPRNIQPQYNNPQPQMQRANVQPQYNNPQVQRNNQPQNNTQPQVQHYNAQPQNNYSQPQNNYSQQQHNAIEYHRNTWQQTQPAEPAFSRPAYQPAPSRPAYQPSMQMSRPTFSAPSRPSFSAPARSMNSGGRR